jgi:hypothetical protein
MLCRVVGSRKLLWLPKGHDTSSCSEGIRLPSRPAPPTMSTFARCTTSLRVLLLAISLSACASTPVVSEFPVTREPVGLEIVPGMPALNSSPIFVWLYTGEAGAIVRVRATGHASEAICAVASKALFDLRSQRSADGIMSFGIADVAPKSGSERAFDRDARNTAAILTKLATEHPDFVVVHTLPLPAQLDRLQAGRPQLESGLDRNVFLGMRKLEAGPALVPLRRFDASGVTEVSFTISREQLGIPEEDLQRLAGDIQLAPLIDYRDRTERLIATIDDTIRVKHDPSIFNDGKWAYYLRTAPMSSLPAEAGPETLALMIRGMRDGLRKYEALGALLRIAQSNTPEQDLHMQRATGELERAQTINYECATALIQGEACRTVNFKGESGQWVYFDFAARDADKFMLELVKHVVEIPEERLQEARTDNIEALAQAVELIAHARTREANGAEQYGAFTLVDGLLRGWPIPTDDESDATKIDAYLRDRVPQVWKLVKQELLTRGVRLDDGGALTGVLSRANVLYRVTATPNGYRVQPLYEVIGKYAEVWDRRTGLVTIETPYDNVN